MFSRRDLLRTAPAAAVAAGLHSHFASTSGAEPLVVRVREPRNLETPLSELFSTDTEKFYVRDHFPAPTIDSKTFKLTVEGHVENKLEFTLDELQKMEAVTREIVLECAGNGRVFLIPPVRGAQWAYGAVGQAKWTGVPLGAILERAKVKNGAGDVVLVGADRGAITSDPPSPGAIHFDRGIPLTKAKKDETLVVWNMNEAALPSAHGGPLRAIVGGWYGMASVKWLSRIVVLDKPHAGFWQTMDYSYWIRGKDGFPQITPITAIQPKAVIASLADGGILKAGAASTISGFAWAGENAVAKVELSVDGGKSWSAVTLGKSKPLEYTRWETTVTPQQKGPLKLLVRCTDDKGNTQPEKRDPDRRTYMINHLVPVDVTVK